MPAKKKLPTIFKDEKELKKFAIATIADCAAITEIKPSEEQMASLLDLAYARVEALMADYHAMMQNGMITKPVDAEVDEEFRKDFRERSLIFIDEVFEENGVEINDESNDTK